MNFNQSGRVLVPLVEGELNLVLAFEQWLQWVFIPQVEQLLATGAPLPGPCALRPMGEQAFVHLGRRQVDLLAVLARIDRHASTLVD